MAKHPAGRSGGGFDQFRCWRRGLAESRLNLGQLNRVLGAYTRIAEIRGSKS
jgi:hypothetical protein